MSKNLKVKRTYSQQQTFTFEVEGLKLQFVLNLDVTTLTTYAQMLEVAKKEVMSVVSVIENAKQKR